MDTNSLIKETIKYFETDENNKPKYKFEVYKSGIANYYSRELSKLSAGLIKLDEQEEETQPVSVYTIGDVFDTISRTGESLELQIKSLPATLDNIQASLKEFGFTALNKAIGTIKAAVIPIETIQTVETIYRIVKPLVQKIVNIASIKFHFENAALVAQDVLQYLGRLAVSTAKNYLNRLMDIFLRTPIFAVYENSGDGVSLAEIYGELSRAADSAVYDIAKGIDSVGELMSYVNGADKVMYKPKYSELGITIPEVIVDIYHNPNSRKIYIASEHKLYQIEEDYTTTALYEVEKSIRKIYGVGNNLYYITTDDKIYRFGSNELIKSINSINVVLSDPVVLCNSTGFYDYLGNSIGIITDSLQCQCYDIDDDIIYYIDYKSNDYKLYQLVNTDDGWASARLASGLGQVYGMSYFNKILYIIKKDSNDKYYLTKIGAGYHFNVSDYSFKSDKNKIIWTDGIYSTNGNNIYSIGTSSGQKIFTYLARCNNINCVASTSFNSRNYLVCSSGSHVSVSENGSNGFIWNKKVLTGEDNKVAIDNKNGVPDNIAGCFFYNESYGKNFVAYSQQNVYVVGPSNLSTLFNVKSSNGPGTLFRKEVKSFDSWWDDTAEPNIPDKVTITSKFALESGLIITAVNFVNSKPYVALYSISNSNIKTGIYPATISNGQFTISYSSPSLTVSDNAIKIYSFMFKNNDWYYTDGKFLYQLKTHSKYDIPLTEKEGEGKDGALFIDNNLNIFTSRQYMQKTDGKSYGNVTALADYKTTSSSVQVASTKNTLMFSDGSYVYNIVDNGEDAIDYDLFQICYVSAGDYRLVPSCDAVFIVSGNAIKKIPFYSTLTSSDYGCGYYTDTTLNKWLSAAPYYFVSNILNERKNTAQKDLFVLKFKENFKVELEKLLKNIPDAFVMYTKDRLISRLNELDIEIEGDDGQILSLIKDSVASTVSTSLGMYVQQKFFEKIGDDATYESFAQSVYDECMADAENDMTADFYKIFEEFYQSVIEEAITASQNDMTDSLIRYYQTHKAEWAKSMTDLIDVDKVDPSIYEMILKASSAEFAQKTYRYDYDQNNYVFDYIASPATEYSSSNIINAYLKDDAPAGASYTKYNFYEREYEAIGNSTLSSDNQYYIKEDDDYRKINFNDIKTYYTAEIASSGASAVYYIVEDNADINPDYDTYYSKVGASYVPVATSDLTYETYYELTDTIIDERTLVRDESSNPLYYEYTETGEAICYYNPVDSKYYKYRADSFDLSSAASVASGVTYYERKGSENQIYTLSSDAQPVVGKIYYNLEYTESSDSVVSRGKGYYEKIGDDFEYTLASEASGADSLPLATYYEKKEYEKASGTTISADVNYYTEYYASTADLSLDTQYYKIGYEKTADTMIQEDKSYYEIIDLTGYASSAYYRPYQSGDTGNRYDIVYVQYEELEINDYDTYYVKNDDNTYSIADEINGDGGPYYTASFASNASGTYVIDSISESDAIWHYNIVQNPQLNNIGNYYEQIYKPIKKPTTSGEYYIKDYLLVESPSSIDLDTYYVKASNAYVEASNLEYVYHGNGFPVGVINDRDLYTASSSTGNYDLINIPDPVYFLSSDESYVAVEDYSTISQENTYYELVSGVYIVNNNVSKSPFNEGWYEKIYIPVIGGIEESPHDLGLYEVSDEVWFDAVENPEGSPVEHGWYEESAIFSIPFEDEKLYIDLGGLNSASSAFVIEDNAWHDIFYTKMSEAKASVTASSVEQARTQAITALNGINSVIYPSWLWQSFITAAVTEYYVPTQGEQYRNIVLNSNMYPIQWDELPVDINHEAFDYALTILLYEIKQRLMTNISILVDQGKVKCYSCLDASTIIRKMVEENGTVWRNQLRRAKRKVNEATDVDGILDAFDLIKAYNISTVMLEKYVDQQSELYAEYIDQIIEEQVINDTESEVSM